MADELTNARVALQRQTREAQGAIQDLLNEREDFSREMMHTHRYMHHLLGQFWNTRMSVKAAEP